MILRELNQRRAEQRRQAFTLLEVLVVVAILVVLASVSSVYVFRYLEDSKKDRAKFDIMALDKAAKTFQARNDGALPDNLSVCLQYIENADQSKLTDPWGKQYQYQPDQSSGLCFIHTTAPDGTQISNTKSKH